MSSYTSLIRVLPVALLTALTGCTVHPPGEREERAVAMQAGEPFEQRIEVRQAPALPQNPTPDQLVEYAQLNNAELEQHYWEWRSAIEQIPQDGTQTSALNVAAGTSITHGRASWGSSTLALSNDPMTDIKWPGKLDAAARQALENARAAGRRFVKSKYDLRTKVLSAYYDYALNAELIRLERSDQQLLRMTASIAEARNGAGSADQQAMLTSRNAVDMSGNNLANMESQLPSQRAALNALLGRPPDAALPVPTKLPALRPLLQGDDELVDLAAKQNPELIALADEIRGRGQGVALARLQYVPDFNLSVGIDLAGVMQSLLGQATIPILRYQALNAAVAQAEANLHAAEAMRRQAGNDLTAQVVADITLIHDADRQLGLFNQAILPRTKQVVNVGRVAYETGHASLLDLLENQRSLLTIERLVANLTITREQHLAELESIAAIDLSSGRNDDAPAVPR